MGLGACVALIVGACVGSAIFSVSGVTVYYAGASAVVSWLLAAVIYFAYGLVVISLARRFPRSGGIYLFPKRAIGGRAGTMLGFVSGWGYVVGNVIAIAFSAICMGAYLRAGFPGLGSGTLTAVAACILALAVLLGGGRLTQSVQATLVALLVCTMGIYCGTALLGGEFDLSAFGNFFTSGSRGASGFAASIPLAMVAYGGCVAVAFVADEVENPRKTLPGALVIGLGIVSLLYALTIFSIVGTLPHEVLETKPESRLIPLFASVSDGSLASFPWLTKVISLCVSVALLSTIIALLRVNSRAVQTMSREGLLPEFLHRQTKGGVPVAALAALFVLAVALCLFPQGTERMISLGAVLNVVSIIITCTALAVCTKKKFFPIAVALVLCLCLVPGLFSSGSLIWIFTLGVYAAGAAVFFLCRRRGRMRISGTVIHGKGKGKLYGMPTANLRPYSGEILPEFGVWATDVILDGREHRAITNVGLRPSVDDSPEVTVETMILDYEGDIYGKEMTVIFRKYIRETRKFANLTELKSQIEKDILVF